MSHLFFQPQTATAPGREGQPQPAPAQPGAQEGAPPPAAEPPGGMGMTTILMLALPLLLLFFMTRNQNKRQKQLEQSLKVGDRVILQSGILGKLVELGEVRGKVEIAPGVSIQILKSAIQGVDGGEAKPGEAKGAGGKDAKDAGKAQEKKA